LISEQNKILDQKWIELINSHDLKALDRFVEEIYTSDFVSHNPSFPDLFHDSQGLKLWLRQLFTEWPDFHLQVEDFIAEGDKVACYGTTTGTKPSGDQLKLQFIHISRYAEGKLVEEWEMDVPVPEAVKETAWPSIEDA